MNEISTVTISPDRGSGREAGKIDKAGRDFEAILIGSLLRDCTRSFSGVPGASQAAGEDDYAYLATQVLASTLSSGDGLGIGKMVARSLLRQREMGTTAER